MRDMYRQISMFQYMSFFKRKKEKFNLSLVSKSKDKIANRSRVNSSITRKRPNETYDTVEAKGLDDMDILHKKTINKKLGGQSVKLETSKILKARRL